MPSLRISKTGKVLNPVVRKIILAGNQEDLEIILDSPLVLSSKPSFCVTQITKFYLNNKEEYGDPEEFVKFLSSNFDKIDLVTQKGRIEGSLIHPRLLQRIKEYIGTYQKVELYRKGLLVPRQ
ncbi:hypothetical protein [Acinetobacter radioresistens]|uniref:hypothetical protein n=1 Tax=Acinetobacter radioresistens TaxID=40216 RepID=UPI003215B277